MPGDGLLSSLNFAFKHILCIYLVRILRLIEPNFVYTSPTGDLGGRSGGRCLRKKSFALGLGLISFLAIKCTLAQRCQSLGLDRGANCVLIVSRLVAHNIVRRLVG